eukprot:COSAG01_NODE_7079_length_3363_cov_2.237439_2_plen_160_part_00
MGIPGYTKWLRTRFTGCFHALDLRKPLQSQHPRARRGYDHVHFDLAARLYLVAARAKSTPHLLKLWLTDLHRMSVWTAPRRTVSLCIDGVPPAAKLWTQRLRRHERTWQPPPSTSAAAADDDGGGGGELAQLHFGHAYHEPDRQLAALLRVPGAAIARL